MKKFIMTLLGIEATAKKIRGNKSNGVEDLGGYKHWRANVKPGAPSAYENIN